MNAQLADWRSRGRSFDYLGFEVFFRQQGAGPVLLLIHGYPFSSFDWHPIWPALTDRFTVIAPDMLGMGFSAKPVEYEYSVHDHADMHEALLQHLGVSQCHVLAHDIGDSVAQELLSRYEDRDDGTRPYEISSITWLNGGMFIEAYRPRLIQTLTAKTPLGALFGKYPGVFLSDRVLRRAVNEVDTDLPVSNVAMLDQLLARSVSAPRFRASLFVAFAGLALTLACVGIAGLVAYDVTRRTREIGIRLALGAQPGDVVGMVMKRSVSLIATGIALGLAMAFALSRLLADFLFDVKPDDPATFAMVALAITVAAAAAAFVPARRATRIQPVIALRYE